MIDLELSPQQKMMRAMFHQLARNDFRPLSLRCDRESRADDAFLEKMNKMGITMRTGADAAPRKKKAVSEKPKGPSDVNRLSALAAEELSWGDAALLMSLPGPGLGGPPLGFMGTEAQREKYFSIFSKKEPARWGAYGLTEPGAGSDVAGIRSTCRKEGNEWVINGRKCFITNGGRASWVIVFASMDAKLGRAGHRAFIVEKGTPGFSIGKIEKKLGLRASETAELVFDDVRVPEENLLGGPGRYSETSKGGFRTAMKTFDSTRPFVAAMGLGVARAGYEEFADWVRREHRTAAPWSAHLRRKVAEFDRRIHAARLLIWNAASMADLGIPNTREASMSKSYACKHAKEILREILDLMRGTGTEQEQLVEKLFRDIQVFDIFEGTGQIQRLIIARRMMPGLEID